jgi:hydroxyacylglutathione hydrolase
LSVLLETFAVGALGCNCTILADEASGDAIVIDGGDGVDAVLGRLKARRLRARYLLHTHAHIDHIGDLPALRRGTGAPGLLHPADIPLYKTLATQAQWLGMREAPRLAEIDGNLLDGDTIDAGTIRARVLHTPGHTPGSVCFAVEDNGTTTILSGDTLFAGSIGRWDLGGTSMEDIVHSIRTKLLPFPDDVRVIPGHGPCTTIGAERAENPFLESRPPR